MELQISMNNLREWWGEDAEQVIEACWMANKTPMTQNDFLSHCVACGGNWSGMLLSGIKKLYPDVWAAIPEKMGRNAFLAICEVLNLLGVGEQKND